MVEAQIITKDDVQTYITSLENQRPWLTYGDRQEKLEKYRDNNSEKLTSDAIDRLQSEINKMWSFEALAKG